MPDYNKAVIYKIMCKDTNILNIYVGSTTNFINRKKEHKYNCNHETSKKFNIYLYKFIRENGGWNNWEMLILEQYNCNSSLELREKERYYFELLKADLNNRYPKNTDADYYLQNKEKIDTNNKNYYDNNELYFKQYRENHKEKNKEYAKKYRETHKDEIKQKNKEQYLKNRQHRIDYSKKYKENQKLIK